MVDVSSQSNKLNITVSSNGVSSNVNASGDTTMYYSNKAKEWATSNRIVDGVDYSSKYYAGRANQSALNAQSFAQSAQDSYNNFQDSVDSALNTVNDTVQGAITTIDTKSGEAIETINNTADGVIEDIEAEANEQIANIERTGFYMRDDKLYFIDSNGEEKEFSSGGLTIGTIIPVSATSDYVPDGSLACDGAEYSKSQFNSLWDNYLTSKEIIASEQSVGAFKFTSDNNVDLYNAFDGNMNTFVNINNFTISNPNNEIDWISANTIEFITDDNNNGNSLYCEIHYDGFMVTQNLVPYLHSILDDGTRLYYYSLNMIALSNANKFKIEIYDISSGYTYIKDLNVRGFSINNSSPLVIEKYSGQLLNTCTYEEYEQDLVTYGQCAKFAVDILNMKFRVPFINKVLTDLADTVAVAGNGMVLGLTDGVVNDYGLYTWSQTAFLFPASADGNKAGSLAGTAKSNVNVEPVKQGYGVTTDSTKSGIIADTTSAKTYLELRYFVVVANGQTNQSMMDWSAWASSLQGKANTDLSNLSESGKKVIDGQWVYKYHEVFKGTTLGATPTGFDISDYLPDDTNSYEVQIFMAGTNTGSGTAFGLYLDAEKTQTAFLVRCLKSSDLSGTSGTIAFLDGNRTVYAARGGSLNVANAQLIFLAYRRLGTNE